MAHAQALPREISLAAYEALVESGALDDVDVELIDGQVVAVSPQREAHAVVIQTLTFLLRDAILELDVQLPLKMHPRSMPEPDLALSQKRVVGAGHPTTARLVIEVVVTQRRAAMHKLPVYAQARVGECWIVDVPSRVVQVHDRPVGRAYTRTRTFAGADVLTPPGTDIRFTAADVFARLEE